MNHKEYRLGERAYVQRPLVLGQIQQLLPLIEGLDIPQGADAVTVAKRLGEKLNHALAIALLEKDVDEPEPEKIKAAMDELAERSIQIAYTIGPEQILEVIEDFFDCNRASSIIERLGKTIKAVGEQIGRIKVPGSTSSGSSGASPKATSINESASSGA